MVGASCHLRQEKSHPPAEKAVPAPKTQAPAGLAQKRLSSDKSTGEYTHNKRNGGGFVISTQCVSHRIHQAFMFHLTKHGTVE